MFIEFGSVKMLFSQVPPGTRSLQLRRQVRAVHFAAKYAGIISRILNGSRIAARESANKSRYSPRKSDFFRSESGSLYARLVLEKSRGSGRPRQARTAPVPSCISGACSASSSRSWRRPRPPQAIWPSSLGGTSCELTCEDALFCCKGVVSLRIERST